eukprot:scaffold100331_cov51-Attheya_sp.AAC.5
MIEGKQNTLTWHVDNIKSSHVDSKVNDKFLACWLETNYGEDGIGSVKTTRGKKHSYLVMVLDFSKEGKLVLDMCDYVKGMVKDWGAVAEKATQDDVATLEADDTQSMQWHIDAAFAVHGDYKSHTGATLMLGKGTVTPILCK